MQLCQPGILLTTIWGGKGYNSTHDKGNSQYNQRFQWITDGKLIWANGKQGYIVPDIICCGNFSENRNNSF